MKLNLKSMRRFTMVARRRKKTEKKKPNLSSSRKRRRIIGDGLSKRIKIGKERAKGLRKNIIKGDIDVNLWRPREGSHIIDIIPYPAGKHEYTVKPGEDNYTFEYYVHKNVGPGEHWFLCPAATYDDRCPICEHREKLREKGAGKKIFIPLFPKRRNLYNIISYDRGEERKGVQVWDVSWFYFEKHLMAIASKPDRRGREREVNFAHTENGKSITFTIEPPKSKDDYQSYVGHAFDDRDYKVKNKTLDETQILDEIVSIPTYKQIKDSFWKGGGPKEEDEGHEQKDEEFEELMEEVEELDDMGDLEEFIEENELRIKIGRKDDEEDVKEKIKEALEEQFSYEEAEDEDEDEGEGENDEDLAEQIEAMNKRKLLRYIKDEDLDIDPDEAEDVDELKEMILDELGL
jgi:hypothetical protein